MPYFVYILFSSSRNRFYIGSSRQPNDRLKKHNTDHKGYTGKTHDWLIIYQEEYQSKQEAQRRERQIKSWKSAERIKRLIGLAHPGL